MFHVAHIVAKLITLQAIDSSAAAALTQDAVSVALDEEPLFDKGETEESEYRARLKTASLLAVWGGKEAAGRAFAIGDKGTSFGLFQMKKAWFGHAWMIEAGFGDVTTSDVLKDGRLSMRMGLALMRHLKEHQCGGSVRGALRAYASGKCAGTVEARAKVDFRCKVSEAC